MRFLLGSLLVVVMLVLHTSAWAAAGPTVVDCATMASAVVPEDAMVRVVGPCPENLERSRWKSGSLRWEALPTKTLKFDHASIKGDLTFSAEPTNELSIDLSATRVEGDVIIREEKNQQGIAQDTDHDGYPSGDSEGCWKMPGALVEVKALALYGITARNVVAWMIRVTGSLNLRHASIEDTIYLEHSEILGEARLGFAKARLLEFVGTSFRGGLDLFTTSVEKNTDLGCGHLEGLLNAYNFTSAGTVQMVGLSCTDCTLRLDRSAMDYLALRGATGNFKLSLQWAKLGLLELGYDPPSKSPLFGATWRLDSVQTRGLELAALPTSPANTRLQQFLESASKQDDAIYDRIAKAYTRDGHFDWADSVWCKRVPFARDLVSLSIAGVLLVLVLAIWLSGEVEGLGRLDASLLALDIFLPDLVDLNARARFEDELAKLSSAGQAIIACVRLLGWLVIPAIVWLVAVRLGRG